MGRSANSRNRVFEPIEGGIRTVAADPAKLEDPHLIIYNAVLTLRETTVVTNGDQTDTIAQFMNGNLSPVTAPVTALKLRWPPVLMRRTTPQLHPRISGRGGYAPRLQAVHRQIQRGQRRQRAAPDLRLPQPVAGEGHFISTYQKNGAPIPNFAGEPLRVAIDENTPISLPTSSGRT